MPFFRNFIIQKVVQSEEKAKTMSDNELIELFINTCINDHRILSENLIDYLDEKDEYPKDLRFYIMDFLKVDILRPIVGTPDKPRRYVVVTRYPIERMKSTQILFPIPYTTANVAKVPAKDGKEFEVTKDPFNYSVSLVVNQGSLSSWGGDFDGDKIIVMGLFTNESNAEVESKRANFRNNSLDPSLNPTTLVGIENLAGLNFLTR